MPKKCRNWIFRLSIDLHTRRNHVRKQTHLQSFSSLYSCWSIKSHRVGRRNKKEIALLEQHAIWRGWSLNNNIFKKWKLDRYRLIPKVGCRNSLSRSKTTCSLYNKRHANLSLLTVGSNILTRQQFLEFSFQVIRYVLHITYTHSANNREELAIASCLIILQSRRWWKVKGERHDTPSTFGQFSSFSLRRCLPAVVSNGEELVSHIFRLFTLKKIIPLRQSWRKY